MYRIVLTQEDFETLVDGGTIRKNNTEILLQDIGFYTMYKAIETAEKKDR